MHHEHLQVLIQIRELQALADLRTQSEVRFPLVIQRFLLEWQRASLSAMRVDEALMGIAQRLSLFGRLEGN